MRLLHIHQTGHASPHKKGRCPTTSLMTTHSRVRNEGSFIYPHELFCRDKHLIRVPHQNPRQQEPSAIHYEADPSTCSLPAPYEGAYGFSREQETHQASDDPCQRKLLDPLPVPSHPFGTDKSIRLQGSATNRLPSREPSK